MEIDAPDTAAEVLLAIQPFGYKFGGDYIRSTRLGVGS
jgi:hypothetical protein